MDDPRTGLPVARDSLEPAQSSDDAALELIAEARVFRERLAGLREELERDRSLQAEDASVILDLIAVSWEMIDRRLGRVEALLESRKQQRS